MRKALLTMIILTIGATAGIIEDGSIFIEEKSDSHHSYHLSYDKNPTQEHLKCISNVIYYIGFRSMSVSYNPVTGKPYYCQVIEKVIEKNSLVSSGIMITELRINYQYKGDK